MAVADMAVSVRWVGIAGAQEAGRLVELGVGHKVGADMEVAMTVGLAERVEALD
jgi:hypothetical protein